MLFVQSNCIKCHNGTKAPLFTVTGTDAGTARIMNGAKPIKFRDAINAIRSKPAMAAVANNAQVMASLENVANTQ